jgi:hypothetical protein
MKTTFPYGFFIKEEIDLENLPISSLAPKILTDKKDIEKIQPYLDSLNKTINQKGISNIALTGGYGSGKSTIIKTFQNINRQHEYLNISLASFNDVADEEGNRKAKKEELERLLEVSILQQIFYHVKPSEIPDSRFKRIINVTDNKILSIAIGLIFWVLSTLILFKFDYINKINPTTWNLNYFIDWIAIIVIVLFVTGIGLFAKSVIRLFSNSKINKFNIKGELELGDNLDKSVFNEHIEEIIYFFERTKYDVVIIEDLDRFESTDIFTKLREINILLNNTKLITREINFLYAIKDEMFNDNKERVKFFEYIIPVIPFINPSNAGDQLTKMISEANLQGVLSKDFTEDVVTFIDDIDMRLLINIFHEYQLYRKNLINDIDQDCLFAIITYKNLFPADFGDLQKRKGNLYIFLSKKENYTTGLKQKIQNQINEINSKITAIDDQKIVDVNELKAIYINALHKKIPRAVSLNLEGKILFSELMDEDNFQKLIEEDNISYYSYTLHSNPYFTESNRDSNFSFSDIETLVNPNFSYFDRKQQILDRENNAIEKLKKDIEKLKNSKFDIESWSLKQIFEEVDINPYLNGFSENGLIRNLLLNGYINENYNDYISLFHEVNLTKGDYSFERKIKSGLYSPFDYNLSKIENLIKRIPEKYFYRDTILNFDIVDFLAENYDQYNEKYSSIIKILGNEKKKSTEFIENYIENRKDNLELFIKLLSHSWKGFWHHIEVESDFTKERIDYYLGIIIKYADNEDFLVFKDLSEIDDYIEKLPNFLSILNNNQYDEKVEDLFRLLDIKFKNLDQPTENTRDLFNYVYENNHYEINVENIILMANEATLDEIEKDLLKANYTTILIHGCTNLINYIEANINDYVKNVLLKIPDNNSESEEILIDLLNNQDLKDQLKFDIIKKQNLIFNDLSEIENIEVQKNILDNNKVLATWNNIYAYYENKDPNDLDEIVIDFLNIDSNYNTLSNITFKQDNEKDAKFLTLFAVKLIFCNDLNLESYSNLLKQVTYFWNDINFENLDFEKVECMINQKKVLNFSLTNFDRLKEKFPDLHITFVEKNQDDFLKKITDYSLDEGDILMLLKSTKILEKNKIQIIEKIEDDIIIGNEKIGIIICNLLAISNYIPLEYNVLESLFTHSDSIENRIQLLNKHLDKISNTEIQNLIELLGPNYKEIFKKQFKPKFNNTPFHEELFEKLKSKNLILKKELDKKDKNKIKVFAKY